MVKKRRRLPAASTPITTSGSGDVTSYWSPWSPIDCVSGGHVVQQTGRTPVLTVVPPSLGVTSFPVIGRQQSALWSPYLNVNIGESSQFTISPI